MEVGAAVLAGFPLLDVDPVPLGLGILVHAGDLPGDLLGRRVTRHACSELAANRLFSKVTDARVVARPLRRSSPTATS
jgi:hypothetical protein